MHEAYNDYIDDNNMMPTLFVFGQKHVGCSLIDILDLAKHVLDQICISMSAESEENFPSEGDGPAHHFVSRFFGPRIGIPEDAVNGSAHCTLGPYWSDRLGLKSLRARQVASS